MRRCGPLLGTDEIDPEARGGAQRSPLPRDLFFDDDGDGGGGGDGEGGGSSPAAAAPAWDDLPDTVKLIVVKELTQWFAYDGEVVRLLGLSRRQDRAFRALCAAEQRKQARFEAAVRADMEARAQARQRRIEAWHRQRASWTPRGALRGPAGTPTSTDDDLPPVVDADIDADADADADAGAGAGVAVPPRALLTDFVTAQQVALGEAFLVAAGFARSWVDLGHWQGHSRGGRFEIDLGPVPGPVPPPLPAAPGGRPRQRPPRQRQPRQAGEHENLPATQQPQRRRRGRPSRSAREEVRAMTPSSGTALLSNGPAGPSGFSSTGLPPMGRFPLVSAAANAAWAGTGASTGSRASTRRTLNQENPPHWYGAIGQGQQPR